MASQEIDGIVSDDVRSPIEETAHRSPSRVKIRLAALATFAACAAVLGIAVWLSPDPRGFGTHQQLGFGICGMLLTTGFPCPTCGMTTAFSHTVRGQWLHAVYAQPTGFVLALGTAAIAAISLFAIAAGRWPRIRIPIVTPYRLFMVLLVLFIGGWAIKLGIGLLDGSLPVERIRYG